MRSQHFPLTPDFRKQALFWASGHDTYCFLNYSNRTIPYAGIPPFPCMLAAGSIQKTEQPANDAFASLKALAEAGQNWVFGYMGYDLKNELEKLESKNPDHTAFPDLFFFIPHHRLVFADTQVEITSATPEKVYEEILQLKIPARVIQQEIHTQQRVSQEDYIRNIGRIKDHILEGNVYELNYCMEFFADHVQLDPEQTFLTLCDHNPMPFAALLKNKDKYILSASPERFIRKEKNRLISQPMKGTARRGKDKEEDEELKEQLRNSEKERAENMMIVDLVRNDLARSSKTGTTKVDEMFGVYSLPHVHQMISTVSSELREEYDYMDALKHAFPMGSMTGAPKIRAMQLIDTLEYTRRNVFSGALGYIDPEKNFDFNVLIRSIIYNASSGYLSFHTGSAITYDSVAEEEYEECMLKAAALKRALGNGG